MKSKVRMLLLLVTYTIACLQLGTEAAAVKVNIPGDDTYESTNHHNALKAEDPIHNHPLGVTVFEDCADYFPVLYWNSDPHDGVYPIRPESSPDHFNVTCDMTTDGGGWTVIQRRFNGSINFDRRWADYKNGFGNVEGEHWLGLDKIYMLTAQDDYELYVELEDWEGNTAYAAYSTFSIGDESTAYTLNIGGYSTSGDAGESMIYYGNSRKFSTRDADNDAGSTVHCAQWLSGGWWYTSCGNCVLNGPYFQRGDYRGSETGYGMWWYTWKGTPWYSLKATKMMVRPRNFNRKL